MFLRFLLLRLIRSYQLFLSPLLPAACRFTPSCSHYARDAILAKGAVRGGWLAFKRVMRCNPWGGGGYDPVADATHKGCSHE